MGMVGKKSGARDRISRGELNPTLGARAIKARLESRSAPGAKPAGQREPTPCRRKCPAPHATALADDVIMASTDALWLSLFSSEGSTLEGTGHFGQASSQEN